MTTTVQGADTAGVGDLPLVEVAPREPGGHILALVMSGDGGWASMIKGFSDDLSARGIAVIGLKSASYLSRPRTPEETARDMERVLRTYLDRWGRDEIVLAGYSRGADMAPFIANRLPADLKARIRLVAMFGPEVNASFEFHRIDLIRSVSRPTDIPTLPEVEKLKGVRMLCIYGQEEEKSLCPAAPEGLMRVVARPGGHRVHDARLLSGLVLEELGLLPPP
jgi:type IV secretory pathway VirJ component